MVKWQDASRRDRACDDASTPPLRAGMGLGVGYLDGECLFNGQDDFHHVQIVWRTWQRAQPRVVAELVGGNAKNAGGDAAHLLDDGITILGLVCRCQRHGREFRWR